MEQHQVRGIWNKIFIYKQPLYLFSEPEGLPWSSPSPSISGSRYKSPTLWEEHCKMKEAKEPNLWVKFKNSRTICTFTTFSHEGKKRNNKNQAILWRWWSLGDYRYHIELSGRFRKNIPLNFTGVIKVAGSQLLGECRHWVSSWGSSRAVSKSVNSMHCQ